MPTKNLLVLKKTALVLSIGWTVLIAILCLAKFNDLPSFGVSGADKYVHFTFHFGFIILWGFYASVKHNEIVLSAIMRLVVVSILYGILIEILQETLTTTRHADIFDVMANGSGAAIALLVFLIAKRIRQRQKAVR